MGLAGALRMDGANELGVSSKITARMTEKNGAASQFGAKGSYGGRTFDSESQSSVARQLMATVAGRLNALTGQGLNET